MKIYEFSTCGYGKLFAVREIEVEEKPKTYIGNGLRINKSKINVVSNYYGHIMYCLENNPKIYIDAVIEKKKRRIAMIENDLKYNVEVLEKWILEKERIEGERE